MFASFVLILAIALQNPAPRPVPQNTVSRPPNHKSENAQQSPDAEQRGTEQSPFVIKILQSPQAQNETNPTTSNGPKNPDNSWTLSDKIAAIAIIVGIFQFFALVVTVLVMSLNGRRQLRAYVLQENSGILEGNMLVPPQPAKANIPGVGMIIKNSGQTPAYKVVSWAGIAVIPVADENTALILPAISERFAITLGAGGSFSKALWFDRPLTVSEIADIATGVRAIYLHGRIEYRDAFKKRRFSNFRLRYAGQFPPPEGAYFNFSERGNDAR